MARLTALFLLVTTAAAARSERREVTDFDQLRVGAGIRADVTTGGSPTLTVEASDSTLPEVETVVDGGVLRIGFREGHHAIHDNVRVTIRTQRLRSIAASGGAFVRAEVGRGDELKLQASGGGEVHVRGVDASSVAASASGGAVIEAQGRAERLDLRLSGGARFSGRDFAADDVQVEGSGGAVGTFQSNGKVSGDLSGGSRMRVRGRPRVTHVSSSGGSAIDVDD